MPRTDVFDCWQWRTTEKSMKHNETIMIVALNYLFGK